MNEFMIDPQYGASPDFEDSIDMDAVDDFNLESGKTSVDFDDSSTFEGVNQDTDETWAPTTYKVDEIDHNASPLGQHAGKCSWCGGDGVVWSYGENKKCPTCGGSGIGPES